MIEILYEDNHLIAVEKPAGLLTQPTNLQNESLETLVKAWIKEKYQKPGNVFLGIIHRLDKPVSGIVLFAKTSKALSRMNTSMRSREMQKTYSALVEGRPPKEKDTLEHFLIHDEHFAQISQANAPEAKLARLHYEVLHRKGNTTLLKINLETGRYHQIRAQCAAIGCPIVGDLKYGSHNPLPGKIIALHHNLLQFKHPITHTPVSIESPLPDYLS